MQTSSAVHCALQRVISDVRMLLRPRNINSAVYSATTLAFLGMGAAYIWAPTELVTKIIAHANTPDATVLWRSIGATLLVLPSWGVTLKVMAPVLALARCITGCIPAVVSVRCTG